MTIAFPKLFIILIMHKICIGVTAGIHVVTIVAQPFASLPKCPIRVSWSLGCSSNFGLELSRGPVKEAPTPLSGESSPLFSIHAVVVVSSRAFYDKSVHTRDSSVSLDESLLRAYPTFSLV